MSKYVLFVLGYVIVEIVFAFLFHTAADLLYRKSDMDIRSIFKGFMERLFLFVSLANGYHHALTFFSAVKLATRLKHKEKDDEAEGKFNDYYLVGNLVSVLLGIGYVYIWDYFRLCVLNCSS